MKVDKGIPLPPPKRQKRPKMGVRKALEAMEIGDSFAVKGQLKRTRDAIHNVQTGLGRKFIIQNQQDGSYRAWRIE